jgi:hypothetical protein
VELAVGLEKDAEEEQWVVKRAGHLSDRMKIN